MGLKAAVKQTWKEMFGSDDGSVVDLVDIVGGRKQDAIDLPSASAYWTGSTLIMACLQLRMNALAQTAWRVVDANDDPIRGPSPLPFDLERPHLGTSRFAFLQHVVLDLGLYANCYIHTTGDEGLVLLPPGDMELDERRGFYVTAQYQEYPVEEVIHIYQPGPGSRQFGTSRLNALKGTVEIVHHMREYIKDWFVKGGQFGGIITSEASQAVVEKQKEAMLAAYGDMMMGEKNRHQLGVFGNNARFEQFTHDLASLSSTQMRQLTDLDILQAYNTPIWMVPTSMSQATGLGSDVARTARRGFWNDVLIPQYDHIASELSWYYRSELGDRRIEFDYKSVPALQPEPAERAQLMTQLLESGWLTPEAAVRELGLQEGDLRQSPETPDFGPGTGT